MGISKKLRQRVYDKFSGKCGYTGKYLGADWQVDHIIPLCWYRWGIAAGDPNHIDNLLPALRIINHYKRSMEFEMFREFIGTLQGRINKLPKNSMREQTIKQKQYLQQVADHFDITNEKQFTGIFYFETIK